MLIRLANGEEPVTLLTFLKNKTEKGSVKLLVPDIVKHEWDRNKTSVVKNGTIKRFDECVSPFNRFSILIRDESLFPWDESEKSMFDNVIKTLKEKKPTIERAIHDNIDTIDGILNSKSSLIIKVKNRVILKASQFALDKKAPFGNKNSFADALIVFTFLDYVKSNKIEGARFVSVNTKDFCEKNGPEHSLHSDLVPSFEESKSKYFRILGEAINTIEEIVAANEIKEMNRRLDEDSDDIEFCGICDGNADEWGNIVDLSQIIQFSNRNKKFVQARIGYCNYCNSLHIECPRCKEVTPVFDGSDITECNGACGCSFEVDNEYDSDGIASAEYKLFVKSAPNKRCC